MQLSSNERKKKNITTMVLKPAISLNVNNTLF